MSISAARGLPGIRASRALAVQEQQAQLAAQSAQSEKITKALGDTASVIQGIVDNAIASGKSPTDPSVIKAIEPLVQQGAATAAQASQINPGINYSGNFVGQVQSILTQPSLATQREVAQADQVSTAQGEVKADEATLADRQALLDKEAEAERARKDQFSERTPVSLLPIGGGKATTGYRQPNGALTLDLEGKIPADGFVMGKVSAEGAAGDVGVGLPVGKAGENQIDKSLIAAGNTLDNISQIRRDYDKSFLEFSGKAKQFILTGLEKFGRDLSPEEKASVKQFSTFATNTFNILRS